MPGAEVIELNKMGFGPPSGASSAVGVGAGNSLDTEMHNHVITCRCKVFRQSTGTWPSSVVWKASLPSLPSLLSLFLFKVKASRRRSQLGEKGGGGRDL